MIFRDKMIAEITLYCRAVPLPRGRRKNTEGVYQDTHDQADMLEQMQYYSGYRFDCPMIIDIFCEYQKYTRQSRAYTYDVDNLMKAVLDNMQRAFVIQDDRHIQGCYLAKLRGPNNRVTIKIFKAHGAKL